MPMSSCGIPLFLMEPCRTPICSQKCPPSLVVFAVDPSSQFQEFQEQRHGEDCFSRPKIPPQLAPYLSGTETSTNMITGELKSQVDKIWEAFWTGGISNPISVPAFTCIQLVHSAHSGDGFSLDPPLVFDGFVGVGNAVEADAGLLLVVASHVAHRRGVRSRLKESRPLRLAANTNWTCVI